MPARPAVQKVALTVFLAMPVLLVSLMLVYAVRTPRPGVPSGGAAIGMHGTHGAGAQPGTLVQPESLEQGFVLIVQDKSGLAGPASPIYLASNLTGWNPADQSMRLQAQSDSKWRIVMGQLKGGQTLQFKFTRGSWDSVELTPELKDIENRTLAKIDASKLASGEQPRIEFVIEKWADQRENSPMKLANDPYMPIEATGTLKRLQFIGGTGGAEALMRDALVWLPPGYDDPANSARAYPVMYVFDGQNLFSKHAGIPAEWGVDETLTRMVNDGAVEPFIVVGLPHGGGARMSEYLPVPALKDVKPAGAAHVQQLIREVMPRVQRAFRVKTGPDYTGIGGASLGGAMALYAATSHPETFGLALVESLPLTAGDSGAWEKLFTGVTGWPKRIVIGAGGNEMGAEPEMIARNRAYIEALHGFERRLTDAGLGSDRKLVVIDPDAVHNEQAWAKRFPEEAKFLFPPVAK